jgi:hypothetical protein
MRRILVLVIGLIPALVAAACGAGGGTTLTVSHHGQTYQDSAGWTIEVPPGWHALRFRDSKDGITSAGVQLSNIPLPLPSLIPGYPIQVNDRVLPPPSVGLIIATDTDPKLSRGPVAVPPLPLPWPSGGKGWLLASSPAIRGASIPVFETLWFRANGTIFIASAKVGAKAKGADLKAFAGIIQSLRLQPAGS